MANGKSAIAEYYARRAAEYDEIYRKPERQADIATMAQRLTDLLAGRTVLEVACGTGFWTQFVARRAAAITGGDINEEVLAIARARLAGHPHVQLVVADAFNLAGVGTGYTGALVAFWWSHIRKTELRRFLTGLDACLAGGARVVFADNLYVEGSSTPISRTDCEGNTYQTRRLKDGTVHEVLKNFPSESDFAAAVEGIGRDAALRRLRYFWYGWYERPA